MLILLSSEREKNPLHCLSAYFVEAGGCRHTFYEENRVLSLHRGKLLKKFFDMREDFLTLFVHFFTPPIIYFLVTII